MELIPKLVETRVKGKCILANEQKLRCTRSVAFELTLDIQSPRVIQMEALVMAGLQYDLIFGDKDICRHDLLSVLTSRLGAGYANQTDTVWITPNTMTTVHVIKADGDDDFINIEVYPHSSIACRMIH